MVVHALSAGRTLLVEGIGRVWRWRLYLMSGSA